MHTHAEDMLGAPLPGGPHRAAQRLVLQQTRDAVGQGARVARRDEEAIVAVSYHLRNPSNAGSHDRSLGGHRLERREAEWLDVRRDCDDVERLDQLRRVATETEESEAIAQAQRRDLRLHLAAQRAAGPQIVAENREDRIRPTQPIGRFDEFPDTLDLRHLAGDRDDRTVGREVELLAARGAFGGVPHPRTLHRIVDHRRLAVEQFRRLPERLSLERFGDENRERERRPEEPLVAFPRVREAEMGHRRNRQQPRGVAAWLVAGHVVRVDDRRAEPERRGRHAGNREAAAERLCAVEWGDRHDVASDAQGANLGGELPVCAGQDVRFVAAGVERAKRHQHGPLGAAEERRPGEIHDAAAHRHLARCPDRIPGGGFDDSGVTCPG